MEHRCLANDNAPYYAKQALEQIPEDTIHEIKLSYIHIEFNQDGFGRFQYESYLKVGFEMTRYKISDNRSQYVMEKLYTEPLTNEEIKAIVADEKKKHFEFIKNKYESAQYPTDRASD